MYVGRGDSEHWCKADAVNNAIAQTDADILVIADSDVWTEEIHDLIDAMRDGTSWAALRGQVWRLSQTSTLRYMAGERGPLATSETHELMVGGGIVAVRRDVYDNCPLDPRFVGWGGEDQSWGTALRTLHGEPRRVPGRVWHLWHPPQARRSRVRGSLANTRLAARYLEARGDPAAMRLLVDEGRAWASNASSLHPSPS